MGTSKGMAHGLVKTKQQEARWQIAMNIVKKQYDKTEDDGVNFWRLVTGVFKNLEKDHKKKKKRKTAAAAMRKIAQQMLEY